jgi:hypothetical protein
MVAATGAADTLQARAADRPKPTVKAPRFRNKPSKPLYLTLHELDGRTRASRRARELIQQYTDKLGAEPTPVQQQVMMHAAVLAITIEHLEVRALQGETINHLEYATLINAQRRTEARLSTF